MLTGATGEVRAIALGPDGTALVGAEVTILVAAPIRDERTRRLWSTAQVRGALDDVVDVLGAEDPASLPDMAVVGLSSDRALVLVLVRGAMTVALTTEEGSSYLGTPVQTWSEHPWDGPASLHIGVPGLAGGSDVGPDAAEVTGGLVPARAVALSLHPVPGARLGLGPLVARSPAEGAPRPAPAPSPVEPYVPEPGHETVLAPPPPAPSPDPVGPPTSVRPLVAPPPPERVDPVPSAAATPVGSGSPEAGPPPDDDEGRTITAAEVRRILGSRSPSGTVAPAPTGTSHMAVRCPDGHLNPVHAHRCRACGAPLARSVPELVADLSLGAFHFSTGQVVAVDRPMLIGRSPIVSGEVRGRIPELVAVASPDQDVSRTHLEVRLEGWQVLVIDRDSTNGTTVELPGREPQRLRPDHPFPLPVGAVVSLAGEVDFTFEVDG